MESESIKCKSCGRNLPPDARFPIVCLCKNIDGRIGNFDCVHRDAAAGVADCSCEGRPPVHWCKLLQGHCTIHATGKPWSRTTGGIERTGKLPPCIACDRRNEISVYDQPTEPPTSDKLLITVAIGKTFQAILNLTRPIFQRYAARIGADYREITDAQYPLWQHEKMRVHNYAKLYDRTMFIDVDCMIRDSCPDLFKVVPDGSIGIHDDLNFNGSLEWLPPERKLVGQSQGVEILGDRCLNSGLIVHSRQHADIWTQPPKMLPKTHCSEQIWIEHQINQMNAKLFYLEPTFNMQWWWKGYYDQHKNSAHIVHLSGCRTNKLGLMRELIESSQQAI